MDRFFQISRIFLGLAWITAVGCGGSEPSVAPTTGLAPTATTTPESATFGANTSASTGLGSTPEAPPKELKNGMTLPDEVPLEPAASSNTGPDSGKGLQLPDDLAPTS